MSRYTGVFKLFPKPGTSEDGFVVYDKEVVKNSLLNILNTHKGSRVYDSDYGTNLHKLIHEPNIQRTRNIAKTEIKDVIEKYEPRAQLLEVNAYAGKGEKTSEVVITVSVKYIEFDETEELEIRLKSDRDWISEEGEHVNPIEEWIKGNTLNKN